MALPRLLALRYSNSLGAVRLFPILIDHGHSKLLLHRQTFPSQQRVTEDARGSSETLEPTALLIYEVVAVERDNEQQDHRLEQAIVG
jgi:hypothetical protein